MARARERVLRTAVISPRATRYQVVQAAVGLGFTIVGIPLLIVVLPIVKWYYERFYARLEVILTNRDLKVHRGLLVREEKSIPLEKITDLRVYQGPIMRRMGLKGLAVETAGQTSQAGALVSIVGIEDVEGFRDEALNQRDRVSDPDDGPPSLDATAGAQPDPMPAVGGPGGGGSSLDPAILEALTDIRDTLRRMEARLPDRNPEG